jgi:hypothetical protein
MIAFNVAARHWKCAKMGISVKVVRCILSDAFSGHRNEKFSC